jgi:Kef-type K+ transport system membrane component KefB/nucleotide-binding universal stress UspA family protein
MRFVQPSEHQVLIFLVQVGLLLVVARLLGQICRRFGQPSVIGELAAGVILGPSILGQLAPGVFESIFPAGLVQSAMLFAVGWLGVIMLLLVTGFETDLALIGQQGKAAVLVTAGSLLVPFAFGLGGGFLAPESLLGDDAERTVFALFLAAALTISSLPVIAKILSELQLLRRNFGQLTLAVAMANDVLGWVLLGLIAGLAGSGRLDLGQLATTLIGLVLFLALAAAVGQRVVDVVLREMRRRDVGPGGWVTMSLGFALALGALTQALGVEAVLGAFIAGILLGRSRYSKHEVEEQLETFTVSIVAPIFFATAGLRVDLSALASAEVATWTVIVILIATLSKFVGSLIGARLARLHAREGLALGTALNARGALEIVIATVGLSLGVLNDASYTIVVIMAIATTVMAPPLLRRIVQGWSGTPEEEARLRREQEMAAKVLVRPGRVLLADGNPGSRYLGRILGAAFPHEAPVTVATPAGHEPGGLMPMIEALGERRVECMEFDGDFTERAVKQAGLGYDVLASAIPSDSRDLTDVAVAMIMRSPLPVVLVRHPPDGGEAIRRVLLPVSTALPARAATEMAIAVAGGAHAELHLLHISASASTTSIQRRWRSTLRNFERTADPVPDEVGERRLATAQAAAQVAGVSATRVTIGNESRGAGIVQAAQRHGTDLVVLGVAAQDVDGKPFLGQTIEYVLREFTGAVVLVVYGPN